MPVLPIADEEGRLLYDAGTRMVRVMVAPTDKAFRDRHAVAIDAQVLYAAALDANTGFVPIPTTLLGALLDSPKIEDVLREAARYFSCGQVAGWILGLVVVASEILPKHASVAKAVDVLERLVLPGGVMMDGQPIPKSRGSIMNHWKKFQSVAPFYAALEANWQDDTLDSTAVFEDQDALLEFLAIGEHYRRRAEAFMVQRGDRHEPLLPPRMAWSTPGNLVLPEVQMKTPALHPRVAEALDQYRAAKKL